MRGVLPHGKTPKLEQVSVKRKPVPALVPVVKMAHNGGGGIGMIHAAMVRRIIVFCVLFSCLVVFFDSCAVFKIGAAIQDGGVGICYVCSGTGRCSYCNGTGYVRAETCRYCGGTGKCFNCNGTGRFAER